MSKVLLYLCAGLNHLLWSHIVDTCSLFFFFIRVLQILKVFLPISLVQEHTHESLAHIHSLPTRAHPYPRIPKTGKSWASLPSTPVCRNWAEMSFHHWAIILSAFLHTNKTETSENHGYFWGWWRMPIFFFSSNNRPLDSELINLKLITNF